MEALIFEVAERLQLGRERVFGPYWKLSEGIGSGEDG
jgi:hypothetical protein